MERKPLRYILSEFVADEVKKTGLTVRGFAKKAGVSHSTIQKLKYPNSGGVRLDIVDELLNNLGVTLKEIINNTVSLSKRKKKSLYGSDLRYNLIRYSQYLISDSPQYAIYNRVNCAFKRVQID
ncbi:helix-turn-helix domain-containing protein [Erysipelothrix rhusiopathiae]|uniref:helix-turn-helix domain-containing protein n=1 Tax=Erysipelothrix rhusiopathiae TaxID=1648 RepID=UPI003D33627D